MSQQRVGPARQRYGEDSRVAILDATLAIATERGYDGTTLALVSARSGLPKGSIYWHFGSKDRLFAATLEHSYQRWYAARVARLPRSEPDEVPARVRQRVQAAARTLAENPEFWALGLMLSLRAWVEEPEALDIFRRVREESERENAAWWKEILPTEAVALNPELPARLGRVWILMLDGVYLQLRGTTVATASRLFGRVADGLVHYLTVTGLLDEH